jgi:carbon storage regulator CsrA
LIDGQIKIEVLKIKGNTVRLGITAPGDVKVLRGELSPFEIELEEKDPVGQSVPALEEGSLIPFPGSFAVVQ